MRAELFALARGTGGSQTAGCDSQRGGGWRGGWISSALGLDRGCTTALCKEGRVCLSPPMCLASELAPLAVAPCSLPWQQPAPAPAKRAIEQDTSIAALSMAEFPGGGSRKLPESCPGAVGYNAVAASPPGRASIWALCVRLPFFSASFLFSPHPASPICSSL